MFDVRGDYPLKTGKAIPFSSPVKAKASFEQLKGMHGVSAENCAFVLGLNFEDSLADHFCVSEEGFRTILGEEPESQEYYRELRSQLPPLTIAEQRNLRSVYRMLSQKVPGREFNDSTVVEEMVLEASGVSANFSRCSNCNLPMHVENKEDHRCVRCGRENLCSFCLTSHNCPG